MSLSSAGIGSGLDVNGIVSKLMQVESQPLTLLNTKEASYQAKLSAYGNVSSALSSFQSALSGLTLAKFQAINATPLDPTVVTASAAAGATLGNYAINVTALAQAQTLTAVGQTSTTAAIGTGTATTLTFAFGKTAGAVFTQDPNQPSKTLTIDATNNSLQGIRDAINAANMGVSATIVNDGSATPYRLQLTSTTGANKSMQITATPGGDATVSSLLGYTPAGGSTMVQSVAAQDASMTVNGLTVTSSSNTTTAAIPGATLNLLKIGATNVTLANDTAGIQSAVSTFVSAYNTINTALNNLTSYNAKTQQAGPLLGDYAALSIQTKLRGLLGQPLTGLGNLNIKNFSQVGISFQKDGSLALDTAKLQSAISTNLSEIAGLFTAIGKTTDSLVSYVSGGTNTQAGAYAVTVSQLATQGAEVGVNNLNAGATINGTNNVLSLTVDGVNTQVTLAQGTYTSAQLAALVQSSINGNSTLSAAGASVSVNINPGTGFMTVTSNKYGSTSNVTIANSGAGATLIGAGATTTGVDVAGTINGVAAIGSGQNLTGATGSSVDGLKLQITGGALGARGTVDYSLGYGTVLGNAVSNMLSSNGTIPALTDGVNKSIADIGKQRDALNLRLASVEKAYRAQFTALDVMMGKMQSTSTFLAQQLAGLSTSQLSGPKTY